VGKTTGRTSTARRRMPSCRKTPSARASRPCLCLAQQKPRNYGPRSASSSLSSHLVGDLPYEDDSSTALEIACTLLEKIGIPVHALYPPTRFGPACATSSRGRR